MQQDTICALATPAGTGGIGVIRISGSGTKQVMEKVFERSKGGEVVPRYFYYGKVQYDGMVYDQALCVYFASPFSYTGEDVVEFHLHGGLTVINSVLSLLVRLGVRPAQPGEFTKRAFLNGKISLSQAEGVMDFIGAISQAGAQVAMSHMSGKLSQKILKLQDALTDVRAQIEAGIEYPEEDLEESIIEQVLPPMRSVLEQIKGLLSTYHQGKVWKEGVLVAIVGKPNVGKSSLLNTIANDDRAIVTDIPGTTRDVIEYALSIKDLPIVFLDTAGIRKTEDVVESIGVDRTLDAIQRAEIVLFVLDSTEEMDEYDWEIFHRLQDKKAIILLNKVDAQNIVSNEERIRKQLGSEEVFCISAKTGQGIEPLLEKIYQMSVENEARLDGVMINNQRHEFALRQAEQFLQDAIFGLESGVDLDCCCIDLNSAWDQLGQITGVTVSEEVIDRIFEKFCLGK